MRCFLFFIYVICSSIDKISFLCYFHDRFSDIFYLERKRWRMKRPQDVLVIQVGTDKIGIKAFCTVAEHLAGMYADIDFITMDSAENVQEFIYKNHPQLLITGVISHEADDVDKMVKRLRKINPQLVAIIYSAVSSVIRGDSFDAKVEKGYGAKNFHILANLIEDFREGRLRRKTEQTVS